MRNDILIEKVSSRGYLFTYKPTALSNTNYFTSVYAINAKEKVYLCDTLLGPNILSPILDFIEYELGKQKKDIIVFNSHSHYDHVWGNCLLKDSIIISHRLTYENLDKYGNFQLKMRKNEMLGDVEIVMPNILFDTKVEFVNDSVEFFYSPGHTNACASCYDKVDNVLFVGDNIELPIPVIDTLNLDEYVSTLRKYKNMKCGKYVSSHSNVLGEKDLKSNIEYLINFEKTECNRINKRDTDFMEKDMSNRKSYLFNRYESVLKNLIKNEFEIESYWKYCSNISSYNLSVIENKLREKYQI